VRDPSGADREVGGRGIVGVQTSAQAEGADDQYINCDRYKRSIERCYCVGLLNDSNACSWWSADREWFAFYFLWGWKHSQRRAVRTWWQIVSTTHYQRISPLAATVGCFD